VFEYCLLIKYIIFLNKTNDQTYFKKSIMIIKKRMEGVFCNMGAGCGIHYAGMHIVLIFRRIYCANKLKIFTINSEKSHIFF
jgi:hypothetical protein